MRDAPSAEALLRQAKRTLLEDLLPDLPETRRYQALMVASAMAMAAREIGAEDRCAEETAALSKLVDGEPSLESLAKAIRAGAKDGDSSVHEFLLRETAARLAISNPKLLAESS